jgi:hypothetical protein
MLAGALAWPVAAAPETNSDYIVVDRHSGLAISGFDPVAYFTDGAALMGRSPFELTYAGVAWRFRNEGNLAAFRANPDIYMPRFGGYDPVAAAKGIGLAGNPLFWLVSRERLYLFYSAKARAVFAADPMALAAAAKQNWPSVKRTLAP